MPLRWVSFDGPRRVGHEGPPRPPGSRPNLLRIRSWFVGELERLDFLDGRSDAVPGGDERREPVDPFLNERIIDATAHPVAEPLDCDPFDRQRRRSESQHLNPMRPVVLIEDVRQQDLRHAGTRRGGGCSRATMVHGGRDPRKDQGMWHIVESYHVVTFLYVRL